MIPSNKLEHKIQVIGVYSNGGELELRGTSQALKELGEIRLNLNGQFTKCILTVPTNVSAKPYDGFLATIELRVLQEGTMLEIKRNDTNLTISGSLDNHKILAENVLGLANSSGRGNHIHLEYLPDDFFLASTSEPLVLGLISENY